MYSYVPHNDVSVSDEHYIRRWSHNIILYCNIIIPLCCGPDSIVGIAIGYGLDGPGIEFRWGRVFPHLSRRALRPIQPLVEWVPDFFRGKRAAGA